MSHSPGPWTVYATGDEILAADDVVVARKHWGVHEENGTAERWKADARLIAAAPEMLALLKEIKDQAPRSIVEKIRALETRIRAEAVTK